MSTQTLLASLLSSLAAGITARHLAVQRLKEDQRLYNRVLDTLGFAATRPTGL